MKSKQIFIIYLLFVICFELAEFFLLSRTKSLKSRFWGYEENAGKQTCFRHLFN